MAAAVPTHRPSPWSTASRPSRVAPAGPADGLTHCSETRATTQPEPGRAAATADPARHLTQGAPNIKGIGKLRYVVEQTFALLHHVRCLAVRWELRTELRDAFVSLACGLICLRRFKMTRS